MLNKIVFFLLILVFVACQSTKGQYIAQPVEEAKVAQVINSLFDAMRTSDSTLMRQLFKPKAQAYTIVTKGEKSALSIGNVEAFIQAVGSPKDLLWEERIANLEIRVDDGMATAWMDYSFYLGDKFSHCGVNHMVLHREEGKWKIFFLSDTRRKGRCKAMK